jgi:hypothetical protein
MIENAAINGIGIATLITLAVQALKGFGVTNTKVIQAIALVMGFTLVGLKYGGDTGLLSETFLTYVNWFVYALMGGLSSMGLFDFLKAAINRTV